MGMMVYASHGRSGVHPLQEAFGTLIAGLRPRSAARARLEPLTFGPFWAEVDRGLTPWGLLHHSGVRRRRFARPGARTTTRRNGAPEGPARDPRGQVGSGHRSDGRKPKDAGSKLGTITILAVALLTALSGRVSPEQAAESREVRPSKRFPAPADRRALYILFGDSGTGRIDSSYQPDPIDGATALQRAGALCAVSPRFSGAVMTGRLPEMSGTTTFADGRVVDIEAIEVRRVRRIRRATATAARWSDAARASKKKAPPAGPAGLYYRRGG